MNAEFHLRNHGMKSLRSGDQLDQFERDFGLD